MKYLKDLSDIEKRQFFDSFDLVFCDCDGVIWHDLHNAIPGCGDALNYLQQKLGKRVAYVTNNSIIAARDQIRKFQQINVNCEKQDLIHPAQVICDFLESKSFEGLILCYASEAFKEYVKERGFQLATVQDRFIHSSLRDLRDAIYSTDPVKAVIMDVDFNITPWKIIRAQLHLKDPTCLFIGGAADSVVPLAGLDILGPGVFINLLAQYCHRKPIILGKPGEDLKDYLKARFNITDSKRVLFIGDSLKSDVNFGKMCEYQTLLVLTGATTLQDLEPNLHNNEVAPDFVIDSLKDLVDLL